MVEESTRHKWVKPLIEKDLSLAEFKHIGEIMKLKNLKPSLPFKLYFLGKNKKNIIHFVHHENMPI